MIVRPTLYVELAVSTPAMGVTTDGQCSLGLIRRDGLGGWLRVQHENPCWCQSVLTGIEGHRSLIETDALPVIGLSELRIHHLFHDWLNDCARFATMSTVLVYFYALRHAKARSLLSPGVRPSVRLTRWCIVSRRLKISSNFFVGPVAPSF